MEEEGAMKGLVEYLSTQWMPLWMDNYYELVGEYPSVDLFDEVYYEKLIELIRKT